MSIQISGPSIPPDGSVTAVKIGSGAAPDGQVLTADGAGGVAWEGLPAAGGGILATGATVGATSQAQLFTSGVGIGVTSPTTSLQVATSLTTSPRGIMSSQHSAGVDGARFHMHKSRGTNASPTVITAGDMLGRIAASGYDGANYLEMGGIDIVSAGTIASTRVPTEIRFLTATDAAPSVLTQRMVIDKAGNVGIGTAAPGIYGSKLDVVVGASANNAFAIRTTDASEGTAGTVLYFGTGAATGNTYGSIRALAGGGATIANLVLQSGGGNTGVGVAAPTAALHVPASSTARASLRIPDGTAPTTPNDGDIWAVSGRVYARLGGVTKEFTLV